MGKFLLILASFITVSAVSYWAFTAYTAMEGTEISGHGITAMIIGLVLTAFVGFGLMALLFFSNKHGHDDAVHTLNEISTNNED